MIKEYNNDPKTLRKKLSKNFRVGEFRCKCGKCHVTFIDTDLVRDLQILRNQWGKAIKFNSGYRCQSYNRKVKGKPYSLHTKGKAVDIPIPSDLIIPGVEMFHLIKDIFPWSYKHTKKNFIHCDVRSEK